MSEYSERIKEVRIEAKMSQEDMAFEIGMSPGGYAHIDAGTRGFSMEKLELINAAISPIIGDRMMYIVTGKHPVEYLVDHPIDDSFIDKAECLSALEKWLVDMKIKNIIRYKGSVSELVYLFAKTISTKKSNGDDKQASKQASK